MRIAVAILLVLCVGCHGSRRITVTQTKSPDLKLLRKNSELVVRIKITPEAVAKLKNPNSHAQLRIETLRNASDFSASVSVSPADGKLGDNVQKVAQFTSGGCAPAKINQNEAFLFGVTEELRKIDLSSGEFRVHLKLLEDSHTVAILSIQLKVEVAE